MQDRKCRLMVRLIWQVIRITFVSMIFVPLICHAQEIAVTRIYDNVHKLSNRAKYAYALKNIGQSVLNIERVRSGCGACSSFSLSSQTIGAGEVSVLTVVLDSLLVKENRSTAIFIVSNDRFQKVRQILIDPRDRSLINVSCDRLVLNTERGCFTTNITLSLDRNKANLSLNRISIRSLTPFVNVSLITSNGVVDESTRTRTFRVWTEPRLSVDKKSRGNLIIIGTIGDMVYERYLPIVIGEGEEKVQSDNIGCVSCRPRNDGLAYAPARLMLGSDSTSRELKHSLLRVMAVNDEGIKLLDVTSLNSGITVEGPQQCSLIKGEYLDFEIRKKYSVDSVNTGPAFIRIKAILGNRKFSQFVPVQM